MKLILGIPTSGAPTRPFLGSVGQLQIPAAITSFDRIIVTGNYIPAQRELILRRAIGAGADLLLMCDDDMVLPPDALAKLLTVFGDPRCALAGALYYSRDGFRPMVVDQWDPDNTTSANIPAFGRTPVDVAGVGFGCVLIRIDAIRNWSLPYFTAHVFIEPEASRVRVCDEDYLFCDRLRRGGARVVLHPGVRCGHYDRLSGATLPAQWEDEAVTSTPRMAVLQDGAQKLVPLAPATPGRERHERVDVTYVWPEA